MGVMEESLAGRLLIASPGLHDFFRRTVVLIVEHADEGAFGLVLNRASEACVGEAVPALVPLAGEDELIRIGGPVSPESVVVIGEFEQISASPKPIVGDLGMVDPESAEDRLTRVRIYAGHAGWGPGQLESEVEHDAWIVDDAGPELPFDDGDLWAATLESRGGKYALLATMPDDPSLN
jgi:putative transcriptional regulator